LRRFCGDSPRSDLRADAGNRRGRRRKGARRRQGGGEIIVGHPDDHDGQGRAVSLPASSPGTYKVKFTREAYSQVEKNATVRLDGTAIVNAKIFRLTAGGAIASPIPALYTAVSRVR
jgi:hypothetical protein